MTLFPDSWRRAPVLADGLGHAQAAQALHAGEATEVAVLDARQMAAPGAHVGTGMFPKILSLT